MKIAIEAQRIFRPNKHGMDFVALEMIRQLQRLDRENQYYILVSPGTDHCLEETSNFRIIEIGMPSYPVWEQVGLPWALRKFRPDLLHCTSNTAPLFCRVPLVLTLHDIIFLERSHHRNPSFYQRTGRLYRRIVVPAVLSRCSRIITVSDFERQHMLKTLSLDPDRVKTVYNGVGDYFYRREDRSEVLKKYGLPAEFLFFLGNTDPKKNALRVLKAYAAYRTRSRNPLPLVIADMEKNVCAALLVQAEVPEIADSIFLSGYVVNADLPYLYSAARTFLYPSLRESFGIPLLEAMSCGTPVVTSRASALPEIAGPEAVLVDPADEEAIAGALLHLEEDEAFRCRQIEYGLERAKVFSWRRGAEQWLEIYNEVCKK